MSLYVVTNNSPGGLTVDDCDHRDVACRAKFPVYMDAASHQSPSRLRTKLLSTVAVMLAQVPFAMPASATAGPCSEVTLTGMTTVTCTGAINGRGVIYNMHLNTLVLNSNATITSSGDFTHGIVGDVVQGFLTINSTGPISTTGFRSIGITGFSISGEDVSITASGAITTSGQGSIGIYSLTSRGDISIVSNGAIATTGPTAYGISATAIAGGDTSINSTGTIGTVGDGSYAIVASSLQGNTTITASGAVSTAGQQAYAIYGSANANGNVSITASGAVSTTGSLADALYGTSVDGNITITSSGAVSTTGLVARGIIGSSSGVGNTLINSTGSVSTAGQSSAAITAESAGGNVTVNSSGTIATAGANSYGIIGQTSGIATTLITSSGAISTSGEGAFGIIGFSQNGNTTINSSGIITTTGYGSSGILGIVDGIGNVSINVAGAITTAGDYAHAVHGISSQGNTAITLTDTGRIRAISSFANAIDISATEGRATLENAGTVTGSVSLSGRQAEFNNRAGGVFNSGESAYLSSNGTLTNAGTVSPGGTGTILTTSLSGNYVQTATGVLKVDADWTGNSGAGAADLLAISGTAKLAGTVVVNPLNFPSTGGLTREFTVLTAGGGITNNGIAIANTAAVNYALLYPDTNTLNVKATINFKGVGFEGLTTNQSVIGGNLNAVLEGGTTLGFMPALMTLPTGGALGNALNRLAPIADSGSTTSAMATGGTFAGQLLSCRVAGEGDEHAVIREGQCVWARASARRGDRDDAADRVGLRENATFVSAGAQFKLGDDWRIGGGLGHETTNLTTANAATSKGERAHVGGVLKYNPGAWLLAASLTGGHGWSDNTRHVAFGGFDAVATSDSEMSFVAGRFTAAYLHQMGAVYIKPQIELGSTHLSRDGYSESGVGGIALSVRDARATVWSFSPSLELGTEHRLASGGIARLFVKGGATFLDTDTFETSASFLGAPAGTSPFTVTSKVDHVVADFGAGIDLITPSDTSLRLQYDGQFGETTTQHGGSAKLGIRF
jgi:uncharacterized protein with beta-barrel porin domain